jgi:L-ascorbate metabolism protein UlaG (beta-lactamase superfamily)
MICFPSRAVAISILAILQSTTLLAKDPGCEVAALVSTGAPRPQNPQTLAIRWTGYSNSELVYKSRVILLDAYFDRGSEYPPLGFKAADIKKADAILIGHAHFDHMSDAASVGANTKAVIVGAPITTNKLLSQGVDPKLIKTVTGKGGEVLKFSTFQVEPILGRHGQPPANISAAFNQALRAVTKPFTGEQMAESAAIRARGSSDPRIITEGTIAYLITLDNGFRIMFRDSGGAITDYEKEAMQRVGHVDLALAAVAADVLQSLTINRALEYLRTYKPTVYIPAHHDDNVNGLWRPTEPIFQALKDQDASLITISKQYREPVCLDTKNNFSQRAKNFRGQH